MLPKRVARVIWLGDVDNSRKIEAGQHWEDRAPGTYFQETAGSFLEWRPLGTVPVITQPQTDIQIDMRSTQSEAIRVFVRGLVRDTTSSGTTGELNMLEENIVLNGSDFTQTSNEFVQLWTIEKDFNTTAEVLIRDTMATNPQIISRIYPWESRPEYQRVECILVPTLGTQVRVRYFARPPRIIRLLQTIEEEVDQDYLVWRVAGDLHWHQNERDAAQIAWGKAEEVLQNRINQERMHGDADYRAMPTSMFLDYNDGDKLWDF